MAKSTPKPRRRKPRQGRPPADPKKPKAFTPPKPYPDFPLTAHSSGKWMKRINGHLYYFGRWGRRVKGKMERIEGDGWQEALAIYKAQRDDLYAGRVPRELDSDELTVGELRERFLTVKSRALDAGEIKERYYWELRKTADRLVAVFGEQRPVSDLRVTDFEHLRVELSKTWGPQRLANEITRVKGVFNYAFDAELIDKPVRFGPGLKKPTASVIRKARNANGGKMLEADELRKLLKHLEGQPTLRAMVLLGVNGGFGGHDCATLPLSALNLEGGWIDFPRPKTGIPRRVPLWAETVKALKESIAERPDPRHKDAEGMVFVTARGRQWLSSGIANPVSHAIRNAMKAVGIHRHGIGPYALRHVFRTIADEAHDQPAANAIMGHSDGSMAAVYRERISDARLRAVVDHVHGWLFGNQDQ